MSNHDQPQYSGALLEILQELGVQDERRILKGLMALGAKRPVSTADILHENSPWLSRVEKHILAVHRDELVKMLEEECLRIFLSGSGSKDIVVPNWDDQGRKILPLEPAEFIAKRDETCARMPLDKRLDGPRAFLQNLMPGAKTGAERLLEVAEAAYLLRPSDRSKIYVARGEQLTGNIESAKGRLMGVYRDPCQYLNSRLAAGVLGQICAGEGQVAKALEWYKVSATGGELWPSGAVSWFARTINDGTQRDRDDAVEVLSIDYNSDHPAFPECLARLRTALFSGQRTASPESRRRAEGIPDTTHDHVQGIKNLFL